MRREVFIGGQGNTPFKKFTERSGFAAALLNLAVLLLEGFAGWLP